MAAHLFASKKWMQKIKNDKDVSRKDKLAVRPLRAKALGLGITAVTSGTHSLFMCEQL